MSYYKARMYSPTLGRFMQTDPIGYGDGINWYNYVGGDPINGIDPIGTDCDLRSKPVAPVGYIMCVGDHWVGIGLGGGSNTYSNPAEEIVVTAARAVQFYVSPVSVYVQVSSAMSAIPGSSGSSRSNTAGSSGQPQNKPCTVPRQTDAQRKLAQSGNRAGFWQSRLAAGDPFADRALSTAMNSSFLSSLANGWLMDALRQRDELSGTASGISHLIAETDQIGVELMQAYSAQLDRPGGMTLGRWTDIHHAVEAGHGLGPGAYGGTPFFGYGEGLMNWVAGIERCQ